MSVSIAHQGRYRIDEPLGWGGAGLVYRATDLLLQRPVALKVLRIDDDHEGRARRQLVREARAAALVHHPNIVAMYDVGEMDGVPFIVMELVEGRTLYDRQRENPATIDEKLTWLKALAGALAAAHAAGFVHRDVKPANVVVTAAGDLKLLDFGIARRVEPAVNDGATSETIDGRVRGTPRYMAPEALAGAAPSPLSDQYAWGIVAHEMLSSSPRTGPRDGGPRDPYADFGPLEDPSIPPHVAAVVARALARRPDHRFADMSELLRAFDGAEAPTVSAVRSATPPPRRALTLRALLAASVLAAGAAGLWIGASTTRNNHAPASMPAAATPACTEESPARAAFDRGRAAFRLGSMSTAEAEYARAVEVDPLFAPAHLRLAVGSAAHWSIETARAHFEAARRLRSQLGDAERALLEANVPLLAADPPDRQAWLRNMTAAGAAHPDDPELGIYVAVAQMFSGDWTMAEDTISRVLRIDPGFAAASELQAEILPYQGRIAEALEVADRCRATASQCAVHRLWALAFLGRCDQLVAEARDTLAAYPEAVDAYALLADALAATGAPPEAAAESLDGFVAHAPPSSRARLAARGHMRLAFLAGDFVAAERYGDEWRIELEGQRQLSLRAAVTGDLLDLYSETGQMGRAGAVASDFLARQAAWSSDAVVDDDTVVHDVTPAALDVARHAHAITPSQYREGLASWLARMNRLTQPQFKPFVWLVGEADVAETRAEANDALRDLPATGVPPYRPRERGPGVGRAFLLAGRDEEAADLLEGAAARCDALSDPYGNTRAHELLGEALAQRGHAKEACDQYALVLSRWGHARPRSVTAERAASRARSLSCPMPRRSP